MRVLRIVTTTFVIVGVVLLLSYPWLVGTMPADAASVHAKKLYATRMAFYVSTVAVVWFVAAASAILMVRRLRREFEEQSMQNLADLLTSIPEPKKKEPEGDV
jgi:hypothetical protein